jgi:hypothetical protein
VEKASEHAVAAAVTALAATEPVTLTPAGSCLAPGGVSVADSADMEPPESHL